MYCELFTPDRWIAVGVELNPRDCCPNLSYPNRLQISTKKRIPFTPSAFRLANHHEHGNKNITTHVQVNPYNIIIFILLIPEAIWSKQVNGELTVVFSLHQLAPGTILNRTKQNLDSSKQSLHVSDCYILQFRSLTHCSQKSNWPLWIETFLILYQM